MLNIFIGFDRRTHLSFHVCAQSIIARSSVPVAVTPLILPTLPVLRTGLTDFTYTRFLVPWMMGFKGHGLFMDSDIIVQADVKELWQLTEDSSKAVWAIDYKDELKFEKAGVMMFNSGHKDNKVLTPEFIDTTEQNLHKLAWTDKIGALPDEWGHLVMYQQPKPAKLIHYTGGIPIFLETKGLGYADEYMQEMQRMNSTVPWADLMANSVHAKHVMKHFEEERRKANADVLAKAALEQASVG